MSGQMRDDYESLVLTGLKRVADANGDPLLDHRHHQALDRLIACGLAAREGDAFVLRRARDATIEIDESTQPILDSLHALWLRLDDDSTGDDEILYGELGYWQHWGNVLNNGTDRKASPLRMDLMLPEHGSFVARHWTRDLDPAVVEHVFTNGLVDIRMIAPPAAHGAAAETMIEHALNLGVQVRVFPSSLEFSLYDAEIAVFRDERGDGELERHRLTRRRAVVEPLTHLFELRWAAAIPWEGYVRGTNGVLDLLGKGWTDSRIAEALGLSSRTVSRRITEMMRAAGVASRFELGMKYAAQELGTQDTEKS